MSKLIRPPQLDDGEYWIGAFSVRIFNKEITVEPRQIFSHSHQRIDTLELTFMDGNRCIANIVNNEDSYEADQRIKKVLLDKQWIPRKFKVK